MAGKGKLIGGIAVVVIAAAAVYGYLEYQKSSGGAAGKKIALSNNYAGNSWRQAMLRIAPSSCASQTASRLSRLPPPT